MIPKRIAIATEKFTLLAPESPCSCEPIQIQPRGTPKPITAAAMTVTANPMTCAIVRIDR